MVLTHKEIQGEHEKFIKAGMHTHFSCPFVVLKASTTKETGLPPNKVSIWGPKPKDKLRLNINQSSLLKINFLLIYHV